MKSIFVLLTVIGFVSRAECLPLYRGAQTGDRTASATSALAAAGANIIRFQIGVTDHQDAARHNPTQYHQKVVGTLDEAGFVSGAVNVIDLHQAPLLPNNKIDSVTLISEWQYIANRFKGSNYTLVFGILNEPELKQPKDAQALMVKVLKAIRKIDKTRTVSVSTSYADPQRYSKFVKIRDAHLMYELHMFYPMDVTHQGIPPFSAFRTYEGTAKEKRALVKYLKNARDFQTKNKVPMFIGEFSINVLADTESRKKYITDLISIFESYKWTWSYHSWRESPAWDIESNAEVFQVLKDAWAKNH